MSDSNSTLRLQPLGLGRRALASAVEGGTTSVFLWICGWVSLGRWGRGRGDTSRPNARANLRTAREHTSKNSRSLMFFPRLPLSLMAVLAPTSLAFPLAAAAAAVTVAPAVVSASATGVPFSADVTGGGVFRHRRPPQWQQWRRQHHQPRRRHPRSESEPFTLKPRDRRPVSMALPSR